MFCRSAGKSFQKLGICILKFKLQRIQKYLISQSLQTDIRILDDTLKHLSKAKIFTGIQSLFEGSHQNVALPYS
jgi:hypothetical protein